MNEWKIEWMNESWMNEFAPLPLPIFNNIVFPFFIFFHFLFNRNRWSRGEFRSRGFGLRFGPSSLKVSSRCRVAEALETRERAPETWAELLRGCRRKSETTLSARWRLPDISLLATVISTEKIGSKSGVVRFMAHNITLWSEKIKIECDLA